MKRFLACISCLAFVLIVVSRFDRPPHHAASKQVDRNSESSSAPLDVGREFLRALLAGDVLSATETSTPLLAARLSQQQPTSVPVSEPKPTIELLVLAADARNADLAVELRWPGDRLAALRLRLVKLPEGWRVGEVQP